MSADERRLLELAARVSDGVDIDWDDEESSAPDPQQRRDIGHLRLVEDIARLHRSQPAEGRNPLELSATLAAGGELVSPAQEAHTSAPAQWGRLEIRDKLGEGSFGEVYRAWDANLDREVALKLLKVGGDDARSGAVLREGRMLAKVRHPNVIMVHGAESHDGRVGMWMELVRGRTLSDLMRQQGKFGAREAALIGIELCRALAAVHGAGLVHRDIKAENAMRDEGGRFLLMDFGAGRESGDLDEHGSGRISGTPLYIAPEVFDGAPTTARSDIYSMGVLLHHLVTGSYPVRATSFRELREKHEQGERRLLRDERSDLPEPFVQVVERAVAHDPEKRFATAGQMEQALSAALGVEGAPGSVQEPKSRAGIGALAAIAAVVAIGMTLWFSGVFNSARTEQAEVVTPSSPTPGSASAYQVQAALFRQREGERERLDSGGELQVGDELALELRATTELYVYVFNEDSTGNAFALFPLPGFELQNPLPANRTHELPGLLNGETVRWKVDSAGGREHLVVVASPEPLSDFEREMGRLPVSGAIAMPVPAEARERLRGIGGLAVSKEAKAEEATGRLFEMARRLSGQAEEVEGVWMREIELDNPGK